MWRDTLWSEGITGLHEITNMRGSRYQQSALEQKAWMRIYFHGSYNMYKAVAQFYNVEIENKW